MSNWPDSMPSNSTSVHPRSPVLRLVPTFQLLLSMMLESALLNWPDKVEERTLDMTSEFCVPPALSEA